MEEVPKMDPARLLRELEGFVAAEPYLSELTVIQLSLQFLRGTRKAFSGDVVSAVVETLRIDVDKLRMADAGPRIREWLDCFDGYLVLFPLLRGINNGRGSCTLDAIVVSLTRWDWAGAKATWQNDGDKLHQYPGVVEAVHKARLGCRAHGAVCCSRCPLPGELCLIVEVLHASSRDPEDLPRPGRPA